MSNDFGATFRSLNAQPEGRSRSRRSPKIRRTPDVLYIGTETGHLPVARSRQELAAAEGELPDGARRRDHAASARQRDARRDARPRASGSSITSSRFRSTRRRRRRRPTRSCSRSARRCSGSQKDDRNDEFWGHQFFIGENPPTDAVIQFYLKKAVDRREAEDHRRGRQGRARAGGAGESQHSPASRPCAGTCASIRLHRRSRRAALRPVAARPVVARRWRCGRWWRGGSRRRGGGGGGGRGGGSCRSRKPATCRRIRAAAAAVAAAAADSAAVAAPRRARSCCPGTYNVALVVDGKVVDTKPMKVVARSGRADDRRAAQALQRHRRWTCTTCSGAATQVPTALDDADDADDGRRDEGEGRRRCRTR